MPAKLFPDIQTYSCDVVSVCPKFTTDDEQLYHFADLADAHFLANGQASSPEALFQYAAELYGKKWLYQMLAFDAFIGNEDRHENNFDVIVRDGKKCSAYLRQWRQSACVDNGRRIDRHKTPLSVR